MYGHHQQSRSFPHIPQQYANFQSQSDTNDGITQQQSDQQSQSQSQHAPANTPGSLHESASQLQTPHPTEQQQQGGGGMIDNLLRRMRDAAGITNAGMVAAGTPIVYGGGGSQTEESLLQQQHQQQQHQQQQHQQQQQQQLMMMMMMGMNGSGGGGGGGAQAAMMQQQQQILGTIPGGYGTTPYMMNGVSSMYQQQQYPGIMMNSAVNYMNPYGQQLLYNQAAAARMYPSGGGMYGGGSLYGGGGIGGMYGTRNNLYGNILMNPYYDYLGGGSNGGMGMGGFNPYSYYRSVDPYAHGYGMPPDLGMARSPYDSYTKQMYYPERTSSVKSLWARDYY